MKTRKFAVIQQSDETMNPHALFLGKIQNINISQITIINSKRRI